MVTYLEEKSDCPNCQEEYAPSERLNALISNLLAKSKFKCDLCPKEFIYNNRHTHFNMCLGRNAYACTAEGCDMRVPRAENLEEHWERECKFILMQGSDGAVIKRHEIPEYLRIKTLAQSDTAHQDKTDDDLNDRYESLPPNNEDLYANAEQISIKKDLYIRLAKTNVIADVDLAALEKNVEEEILLTKEHSG